MSGRSTQEALDRRSIRMVGPRRLDGFAGRMLPGHSLCSSYSMHGCVGIRLVFDTDDQIGFHLPGGQQRADLLGGLELDPAGSSHAAIVFREDGASGCSTRVSARTTQGGTGSA